MLAARHSWSEAERGRVAITLLSFYHLPASSPPILVRRCQIDRAASSNIHMYPRGLDVYPYVDDRVIITRETNIPFV